MLRRITCLFTVVFLCSCHYYSESTPLDSNNSKVYRPPIGLIRACQGLDSSALAAEPECDFYRCEVRLNEADRSLDPTCKYFLNGSMYKGYRR